MVDPLRVSPGGGGREQSWRILPVPAGSGGVQAALGCQVSPSIPCDFTGNTEWAGWMLGCRDVSALGISGPTGSFPWLSCLVWEEIDTSSIPSGAGTWGLHQAAFAALRCLCIFPLF